MVGIFVLAIVGFVARVELTHADSQKSAYKWTNGVIPLPVGRFYIYGNDVPTLYVTNAIVWNIQGTCVSFDDKTVCGSFIIQDRGQK